jgi:hypothetical protein
MFDMTTTTPRRATNVRGYNKTVNKLPLTIPTISAAPDNADYTLLSPMTISSSSQTGSLVSETPNCQDIALDATRCGLPTPPPSSTFNVPPPPVDCRLRAPRHNKKGTLRNTLAGLDRLLQDMPELYGIEDIGELFRLLLSRPHTYGCSLLRWSQGLSTLSSYRRHLQPSIQLPITESQEHSQTRAHWMKTKG